MSLAHYTSPRPRSLTSLTEVVSSTSVLWRRSWAYPEWVHILRRRQALDALDLGPGKGGKFNGAEFFVR